MKNAMELPKSSKTFHLLRLAVCNFPPRIYEAKAKLVTADMPLSAGFQVEPYLKLRQLAPFPRYLLENWPMRCSKRTVEPGGSTLHECA